MFQQEIELSSQWMNAAGAQGFSPPPRWVLPEPQAVFVTNPLSRRPRMPAETRTALPYPGGLLLHSGLPNPGFHSVLRRYSAQWSRASLPVWVHLIPSNPAETAEMVRELEGIEGVAAVEIGLEPGIEPAKALEILAAAAGELPVVAAVPLNSIWRDWVQRSPAAGVSAITLSAPRGSLPGSGETQIGGRLYGPSLFPLVLESVRELHQASLKVIAGAGVFSRREGQALIAAGAAGVQVDLALWKGWIEP